MPTVEYLLSEKLFANIAVGWEKDEDAGIENEYYIGPSVGYKILAGPKHHLKSEAGIDYVGEDFLAAETIDYTRGRVLSEYEYAFNEKTKLTQKVEYLKCSDH